MWIFSLDTIEGKKSLRYYILKLLNENNLDKSVDNLIKMPRIIDNNNNDFGILSNQNEVDETKTSTNNNSTNKSTL